MPSAAFSRFILTTRARRSGLGRDAFNDQMAYIRALTCMLKSNCADIAFRIHIKNGIFVQVF